MTVTEASYYVDRKRRAEDMLKKLVRFCGVTVKESPVLFGLNIVMMLFFIAMQLGVGRICPAGTMQWWLC